MKKNLITCFLCLSSIITNSQNLTLNKILELKNKDLGYVEEYLNENNWNLLNADKNETTGTEIITFEYNKDNYIVEQSSIIGFIYGTETGDNVVILDIRNKAKYFEYLNTVKKYGCKLISSEVEDDKIVKVYKGATTTFEFHSGRYPDSIPTWTLNIFSNEQYYQMYLNKLAEKLDKLESELNKK